MDQLKKRRNNAITRKIWYSKHPKTLGSGKIESCGEVIDGIEYELHGIGCAIHFPTESVDFDYGSNNRIDGFDEWRL
ncbi:DUF6896 domain-containing protein [Pseudomonas siliginis]|uniref:DUF6896 domain-containing protein n=1 Tax=Pseudomonas siliginis TaxID=2842346 RepID=UPI003D64E594